MYLSLDNILYNIYCNENDSEISQPHPQNKKHSQVVLGWHTHTTFRGALCSYTNFLRTHKMRLYTLTRNFILRTLALSLILLSWGHKVFPWKITISPWVWNMQGALRLCEHSDTYRHAHTHANCSVYRCELSVYNHNFSTPIHRRENYWEEMIHVHA